ncbi:HIG1 domain family member 2A, mitochondrial isoform X2 [Molossus molossus]|uniref:HIG1 domain family member 2A, mitochondrial isoform X2 n=1 Tax=Molossus molossus TaxID=27622 RepID=UPI001747BA87|nr:HIG1 domain family member 2A, mitochondrial isoform X2 [Molossus molossus]
MRLRTTLNNVLFSAPFHDLTRRWSLVSPFSPAAVAPDMTTPGPVTPEAPSQPPVIEGFSPSVYGNPESFKEKFLRKTRENPMVPIEPAFPAHDAHPDRRPGLHGRSHLGGSGSIRSEV